MGCGRDSGINCYKKKLLSKQLQMEQLWAKYLQENGFTKKGCETKLLNGCRKEMAKKAAGKKAAGYVAGKQEQQLQNILKNKTLALSVLLPIIQVHPIGR